MTAETYKTTRSGKNKIPKDPNAELDYVWDWTEWLDLVADTIASHQILPATPDIVVESSNPDVTNKKIIAVLSGGTVGEERQVVCRIVTAGGRIEDRSIYLQIKER